MAERKDPHPLLARWESLEGGKQAAIAYPVCVVVITLLHWAFFPKTFWFLGITYGFLWALPATAAIVMATSHERRKRERGDG